MSKTNEELVQCAKLAKQAKYYDDMAQCMKKVVEFDAELSKGDRSLFSFAYNSVIEERQKQWYSALSVELMTEGNEEEQRRVKENRKKAEHQLGDVYTELLTLLDEHLIPKTGNAENKEAFVIAKDKLQPTHPVQLALAFSFSRFYYEILNDPKKACQVAQQALRDANAELENSMIIMELLRDNLIKWTSDTSADNQEWAGETGVN